MEKTEGFNYKQLKLFPNYKKDKKCHTEKVTVNILNIEEKQKEDQEEEDQEKNEQVERIPSLEEEYGYSLEQIRKAVGDMDQKKQDKALMAIVRSYKKKK